MKSTRTSGAKGRVESADMVNPWGAEDLRRHYGGHKSGALRDTPTVRERLCLRESRGGR